MSYWAEFERDNSVYRTPEFRQKMSQLTSGSNNGMYGKKHTEESKQKMSINSKGKNIEEKMVCMVNLKIMLLMVNV